MTDGLIPVPSEAITWLQQLARNRNQDDGWNACVPHPMWPEFVSLGMIEYQPAIFRMSDIGLWVLKRTFPEEIT